MGGISSAAAEVFSDLRGLVPSRTVLVDDTGTVVRATEDARTLFGFAADPAATPAMPDLVPLAGSAAGGPVARVFETGDPVEGVRCRVELSDGPRRVTVDATPVSADGRLTHVALVVAAVGPARRGETVEGTTGDAGDRDASDVDNTEENDAGGGAHPPHERSLERYRRIVETVDDGIYVVDQDGYFTDVNDAYASMVGRSREELLGAHVSTVIEDDETLSEAQRLEAELASGRRSTATLDAELTTGDGEARVGEVTLSLFEAEGGYERVGIVRDVTDQRERQRVLEARSRQQAAIAELGRRALDTADLDSLFDDAVSLVADTLDNDYCKVLELHPDEDELALRSGVGWDDGIVGNARVGTQRDSQAGYTLLQDDPVVVTDLAAETRFSGPDLLLDHDVTSGISVVIGSSAEPWGILGTHDTDAREYSRDDAYFVQAVANILARAIERRRHEAELEASRQRYRTLVDNFPNGAVVLFDEDLRFTIVGGTPPSSVGSAAEIEGRHAEDVVPPALADPLLSHLRETIDGEERTFTVEVDDRIRRIHTVPIRGDDGTVLAGLLLSQDVTDRRRQARRLRRQREQLDAINEINSLVQGISESVLQQSDPEDVRSVVEGRIARSSSYGAAWIGDVDADRNRVVRAPGRETTTVPAALPMAVRDDGDATPPTVRAVQTGEIHVVDDLDTVEAAWAEAPTAAGYTAVAAVPLASREMAYGVLTVYTDRDEAFGADERTALGRLGTVIAHGIESVHRESRLRRSERHYRTLAESIPDGAVTLVDPDLRFQIVAGRVLDTLGIESRDLLGLQPSGVAALSDETVEQFESNLRAALDGERRSFRIEPDGRVFDTEVIPVRDESGGSVTGAMTLTLDVTDSVERQEQLARERERLEFLIRLVRHDLLNSLNVVDARLDIVSGRVDYEVSSHLDTARDRTDDMIDLIETLRPLADAAVVDDGGDLDPVPLDEVLLDEVRSATVTYPEVAFDLGDVPAVEVCADDLLGEVFENLLNNAAQHNDKAHPEVAVDATATEDAVTVTVADNGPGMPEDLRRKLFEAGARDFEDPATGFGLHIVREVVDSYGGEVAVEDADPEGTVVRVTLDRAT